MKGDRYRVLLHYYPCIQTAVKQMHKMNIHTRTDATTLFNLKLLMCPHLVMQGRQLL